MKPACNTIVRVFHNRADAERAITALRAAGYRDDQIGLVGKDARGKTVRKSGDEETNVEEGAAVGAGLGALGGAAVGAGIAAGVIPVIGPVLALGTLGTILVNAAGGAAALGITGALVGWGIPEDDAKFYENEVQSGRFVVTVECGQGDDARDILSRHGGFDRNSAR
jgi:hypothetical protein